MDGFAIVYDIKPERVDDFVAACLDNARATLASPDALRFDLLQDKGSPSRIVLIECYTSEEAKNDHLASAHFQAWRAATQDVHASPPQFIGGRFLVGRGLEGQP